MNENGHSEPYLDTLFVCPRDGSKLNASKEGITCAGGHCYTVEQGIPVLTDHPRREPKPLNLPPCARPIPTGPVDPFVNDWIINSNGNLYRGARGKLERYPIPDWPFAPGEGKLLVDIGCSWGRWSVAAARSGFRPIGIDVHLDALAAARRVARQTGVETRLFCCDAASLPLQDASVDCVFSYSVLQHLDKQVVRRSLREFARVLKTGGSCLVQLPNHVGILSLFRQALRGFRGATAGTFEMRYWSRSEIRTAFREAGFGACGIRADGFLSQNPQLADLDLLSPAGRSIVRFSHLGCALAEKFPVLVTLADSLWVEARRL